jgi:hypothetical protein
MIPAVNLFAFWLSSKTQVFDSTYGLHSELQRACTKIVMHDKLSDVRRRNTRPGVNTTKAKHP